jgi:uncharacterized protein YdaU (DUF1376 family)
MHYYQFNIGDYYSHTKHLSPIEDICYRRALDYYYLHEAPLTSDIAKLARLLMVTEYQIELMTVLDEFFVVATEGFINPRADKEIQQYQSFSDAGKRGAAKRWSKGGDSVVIGGLSGGVSKANAKQETLTTNQEPLTINHKPVTNIKTRSKSKQVSNYDDYPEFLEFWSSYPIKEGKLDAFKSWVAASPPIDKVLQAIQWQTTSKKWQQGYIPMPATYLNQGRYMDEAPTLEAPF